MPDRIPLLEECGFWTQVTEKGDGFIGRVHEFPNLRTRPMANALDARTEIITLTRDKLAALADAQALLAAKQRRTQR